MNWREASCRVLCDKRILIRLKGKFYKTVVRLVIIYGSECRAIDKTMKRSMNVADMRILRGMSGVTREDRIRNECTRGSIGVATMRENKFRWLGHVLRREKTEAVSVTKNMSVDGKRGSGRPKKRWFEVKECDMRIDDFCEEDAKDRS